MADTGDSASTVEAHDLEPRNLEARDARARAVEQALDAADRGSHYVPSEEGYLELPVVALPADVLVYRADNGRILSELVDAAEARGTTVEDLKARAESPEVQGLLRDLLIEKARDPDGPIYDELAHYARQTEPLLITRDGLVVNGNRRLAAMQQLADRDPEQYGDFRQVRAAVLPSGLDRDQLEYIEAALQMAPELKLSYGWINRRLKLRQHVNDLSRDRVAAAYRFKDLGQIDAELGELDLAEAYLSWVGEPGHFRLLADQEEHFVEFNRQLGQLGKPHLVGIWRLIGFSMIRAAPRLDRKLVHYHPFTAPTPPAMRQWVPRALAEDRGLTERQEPGQNKGVDKALAGRLQALLDDPAHAESTARSAMGLIDTLKGNEQQLLGPQRVVHHLRAARDAIESLSSDNIPANQMRRVHAELAAIQQHVRALESADQEPRPMSRRRERRLPWPLRQVARALRGRATG